ncbi:MAG: EF-hand domain-containing protein [Methylovulum sp.]|nr:EF-hand domain-containing protein [Methylovulum sp.]
MKTRKMTPAAPNTTQTSQTLSVLKNVRLSICLVMIGFGFGVSGLAVSAEDAHPNYRYIKPIAADTNTGKASPDAPKIEAVAKPTDGKGALPTFAEADTDGDHSVTKVELKNFPYLLQVFDKVDAGEDGKLEQHEYQNLEMETKREGEVR